VVRESSNDQDCADGNGECRVMMNPRIFHTDSNVTCFNASCASHGVAQVAFNSQVASQGKGVVNSHNADMAMH
jgi:hypothetical protein